MIRSKKYDPRYPNVRFKNIKAAKKAVEIADKLDALSDEEFLCSGYPYVWQDEIRLSNLFLDSTKDKTVMMKFREYPGAIAKTENYTQRR